MNHVVLVGNLGKDCEFGATQSGKTWARFSLATSRKWKDANGEQQESTEWHNVVLWGFAAEHAEGTTKGTRVMVVGRIQNRKWEDKSGQTRYTTEINCFDFAVVPRKERDSGGSYEPPPGGDDIPF